VATVLGNDWFDYPSDRLNRHYGTFTGGSRVLVEAHLGWNQMRAGIGLSLAAALAALGLLLDQSTVSNATLLLVAAPLAVLALGYTAPPLKLAWRGLGELDVSITHSIGVMLCGFVFQGGAWHDPLPWLLSLPLGLGVLPAILLAGIPDLEADRAAGKRTLAVRLGARGVAGLALGLTVAAALAAVLLEGLPATQGALTGIAILVLPHALLLVWLLHDYRRQPRDPGRIDRLLVVALTYIVWFGVVPLYRLSG
ncbi:MAG: prenyltransferase, partial [Candidatus Competibacteraceae bacterium]|nr:prenyltransferase [Candidatus Competibacteraceae bacterium]